jgi:predicted nuclease of predicted toxin-antitoxin system
VKGILADVNSQGPVEDLIREMQGPKWLEFWTFLGLSLFHFEDIGLHQDATDLQIWQKCQENHLMLITDNRNKHSPDSLEATIQQFNTPESLPVFTIADLRKFRKSREYAQRVVEKLYEFLFDIDSLRGTGRLYLP